MLTVYKGHIENGCLVWNDQVSLPENANVIITILDDNIESMDKSSRQKKAFKKFNLEIDKLEPLGKINL